MKINYLILLVIYINYFLNYISCQSLSKNQLNVAKEIISTLYGQDIDDPCGYNGFSCGQIDSDDFSTVISIQLKSELFVNSGEYDDNRTILTSDFSVFKDLQFIEFFDVEVSSEFFCNLNKLTKLNILRIDTHSSPINKQFKLPESLTIIIIKNFGAKLVGSFFNFNLNTLEIIDSIEGFDVTDGIDIIDKNTKLISLNIPIVSNNTQSLFDNLGKKLKSINHLTLQLDSSTTIEKKNIEIPIFRENSFKTLTYLEINFVKGSLEKPNFPYSIDSLTNLNHIVLNSNQFIIKSTKPVNFSDIKPGLYFQSTNKCDYLTFCNDKPCINFPKQTTLNIHNCPNFDYMSVLSNKRKGITYDIKRSGREITMKFN